MLTLEQAKALKPGTILSFGTDYRYEFKSFGPYDKKTVWLNLQRDDGFETFATQHDLKKAEVIGADASPTEWTEELLNAKSNKELESLLIGLGSTPPPRSKKEALVSLAMSFRKAGKTE